MIALIDLPSLLTEAKMLPRERQQSERNTIFVPPMP